MFCPFYQTAARPFCTESVTINHVIPAKKQWQQQGNFCLFFKVPCTMYTNNVIESSTAFVIILYASNLSLQYACSFHQGALYIPWTAGPRRENGLDFKAWLN
jgi:hypothetical protein